MPTVSPYLLICQFIYWRKTMRIGKVTDAIVRNYNNPKRRNRALFLLGKSGVGKSDSVRQAADQLGLPVYDMRLSTSDPTDFGLLMPVDGVLVRQKPAFIEYMDRNPDGGILFLDELSSAPPAVQAPAYQVVLDRACNGFAIPNTWMVVGAGNSQSDRGVTHPIAAPLLNRMTVVKVETVLDDVLMHGAANGLSPMVMAFLSSRAEFLHQFDKEHYNKPFPSPRAWFAVSDTLDMNLPPDLRVEFIEGDVGEKAGATFEAFTRVWESMPDIDKIIETPDKVAVPEGADVRYCVTMGLASRMDKKNFENVYQYLKRMPNELSVLAVKLAVQRDNSIGKSPAFKDWVRDNKHAFANVG